MPFLATWVELEIKWNKSDKDKYGITYMWISKKWCYLQNRNRLTDIENKCMITKGKMVRKDKYGIGD